MYLTKETFPRPKNLTAGNCFLLAGKKGSHFYIGNNAKKAKKAPKTYQPDVSLTSGSTTTAGSFGWYLLWKNKSPSQTIIFWHTTIQQGASKLSAAVQKCGQWWNISDDIYIEGGIGRHSPMDCDDSDPTLGRKWDSFWEPTKSTPLGVAQKYEQLMKTIRSWFMCWKKTQFCALQHSEIIIIIGNCLVCSSYDCCWFLLSLCNWRHCLCW